ncbi:VPLPA-CTERM sorting domain-containing protein [Litorivita sp. NS0012-18]|uniref:VPLPA-CTERM sorting domain-containing protein n=1 Tax=Litorivita sp. NS0012-18 TaxID=3127655 RepID=UPI00310ACD04
MKSVFSFAAAALVIAAPLHAATLTIDGDSLATGSSLSSGAWLSPLGTVSFDGEFSNDCPDDEFVTAGAGGNCFDIDGSETATLSFDFDVASISFVYGGNSGVFDITAFDAIGGVLDSFFQASTGSDEPAGPVTLSGTGIRSIFWQDPGFSFAVLDNITVTTAAPVPLPAGLPLLLAGLGAFGILRRRKS